MYLVEDDSPLSTCNSKPSTPILQKTGIPNSSIKLPNVITGIIFYIPIFLTLIFIFI